MSSLMRDLAVEHWLNEGGPTIRPASSNTSSSPFTDATLLPQRRLIFHAFNTPDGRSIEVDRAPPCSGLHVGDLDVVGDRHQA